MARPSKRANIIERNELFKNLTHSEVESCLKLASPRAIPSGGFLFRQGESGDALHLLTRGRLRLYQVSSTGQQALLRLAYSGELVGCWAWLAHAHYAASAQAAVQSQTLFWNRRTLTQLVETYPQLALNVAQILAQQLEELRARYVYHTTQPVPQRIAWAVLKLLEKSGVDAQESLMFPAGFALKDVADMAGTTIYTVSRVLTRWKHKGLVTKHLREYLAVDAQRFAELAGKGT